MVLANNNASNGGWTVPTFIGWGGANGLNTSSIVVPATAPSSTVGTGQWSDVAPYQEFTEARVAASSQSVTGNTAAAGTVTSQIVGTITAGSGETVAESFLVFSLTKPASWLLNANGLPNNTNTSFTVTTTGSPPATPFYLQVNNEVVKVTTITSSTIFTIVRAQNGSAANSAAAGATVTLGNIPGAGNNNPNSADMFAHAGFVGLALNTNDSIQFTWQVNVTS